jgi:hypothetical protein
MDAAGAAPVPVPASAAAPPSALGPGAGPGTGSAMVAVLPCNNLDASEAFYRRLGFSRLSEGNQEYSAAAEPPERDR